jgi:hypothetical protein
MTSEQAAFLALLTRRVAELKLGGVEPVDCISLCTRRTTHCVLQALGEFIAGASDILQIAALADLMQAAAIDGADRLHSDWWLSKPPLVSIGQGTSERNLTEEDLSRP